MSATPPVRPTGCVQSYIDFHNEGILKLSESCSCVTQLEIQTEGENADGFLAKIAKVFAMIVCAIPLCIFHFLYTLFNKVTDCCGKSTKDVEDEKAAAKQKVDAEIERQRIATEAAAKAAGIVDQLNGAQGSGQTSLSVQTGQPIRLHNDDAALTETEEDVENARRQLAAQEPTGREVLREMDTSSSSSPAGFSINEKLEQTGPALPPIPFSGPASPTGDSSSVISTKETVAPTALSGNASSASDIDPSKALSRPAPSAPGLGLIAAMVAKSNSRPSSRDGSPVRSAHEHALGDTKKPDASSSSSQIDPSTSLSRPELDAPGLGILAAVEGKSSSQSSSRHSSPVRPAPGQSQISAVNTGEITSPSGDGSQASPNPLSRGTSNEAPQFHSDEQTEHEADTGATRTLAQPMSSASSSSQGRPRLNVRPVAARRSSSIGDDLSTKAPAENKGNKSSKANKHKKGANLA